MNSSGFALRRVREEMIEKLLELGIKDFRVLDAISQGAAGSWQLTNRGETMVDRKFDFGFAVKLMRKDLGICLDHAGNNNISLPITSLVNQFYAEVQRNGGSKFDTSSLLTRFDNWAAYLINLENFAPTNEVPANRPFWSKTTA